MGENFNTLLLLSVVSQHELERSEDDNGRAPRAIRWKATHWFRKYAEACRAKGLTDEEQIVLFREKSKKIKGIV